MATSADFRGPRREVALAFSGEPRTLHEAAKSLGRTTSSIYRLVQRMYDAGLLVADSDPPTRGTMYTLAPGARPALEEALAGATTPGRLSDGQRTLIVHGAGDTVGLQRALARADLSAPIAWALELDGAGGMLLGMEPEASSLQVQRLRVGIERAGFTCAQGRVGDVMTGEELRRRATALVELAEERVR